MRPFLVQPLGKRYTEGEARELCPQATGCDVAKNGNCTLADVRRNCSIYKQRVAETLIEAGHNPDDLPPAA